MMALGAAVCVNRSLNSLHIPVEVSPSIVTAISIVVCDSKLITILIDICVVLGVIRSMIPHHVSVTAHKRVEHGVLSVEIRT